MKKLTLGENTIHFNILRDLPYFQPTTNYYGIVLKSWDTNKERTILVRDVSATPAVYQEFNITGTSSSTVANDAVLNVLPYGTYYYAIYPATGSTANDIVTSGEALAKGQLRTKIS